MSYYHHFELKHYFFPILNKGWGSTRFDTGSARPLSLQHDTATSRMSAESSSESEAQSVISSSGVMSGNGKDKDKDKKSGMFRLFSKKKRSSQPS